MPSLNNHAMNNSFRDSSTSTSSSSSVASAPLNISNVNSISNIISFATSSTYVTKLTPSIFLLYKSTNHLYSSPFAEKSVRFNWNLALSPFLPSVWVKITFFALLLYSSPITAYIFEERLILYPFFNFCFYFCLFRATPTAWKFLG